MRGDIYGDSDDGRNIEEMLDRRSVCALKRGMGGVGDGGQTWKIIRARFRLCGPFVMFGRVDIFQIKSSLKIQSSKNPEVRMSYAV